MIEVRPGGRRRIDKVLDPDFAVDLASLDLDELRSRRDEAAQEETDLSYLRRLLQARADLVRAEQSHRAGTPGSTVDDLADVLGAGVTGPAHGSGRFLTVNPSRAGEHRRHGEALAADPELSDVIHLDVDQLARALTAFEAEEHDTSEARHQVQAVMDACNAEIGRRYRDGTASIDGLLDAERAGTRHEAHPAP